MKKVKKSEKLEIRKLPRLSTNFSDAFKYLLMRREWITAASSTSAPASDAEAVARRWMETRGEE